MAWKAGAQRTRNLTKGSGLRHGMGGSTRMRAGRMLSLGDLRLIALALIAQRPRHGYEIIKTLEETTSGAYSPSPGIVYPTLAYLRGAGYVTVGVEGTKKLKLHTITAAGRAYLDQNRRYVDAVIERVARQAGVRPRHQFKCEDFEGSAIPPLVHAAIDNLRVVAAKRLDDDAELEAKLVGVLARAASELKKT